MTDKLFLSRRKQPRKQRYKDLCPRYFQIISSSDASSQCHLRDACPCRQSTRRLLAYYTS